MKNIAKNPVDTAESLLSALDSLKAQAVSVAKLVSSLREQGISDSEILAKNWADMPVPGSFLKVLHAFNDGKLTETQLLQNFLQALGIM